MSTFDGDHRLMLNRAALWSPDRQRCNPGATDSQRPFAP